MKLPFSNPLPEVEIAIEASLKAGEEILKVYSGNFNVRLKEVNDPVTDADINSSRIISEVLSKTGLPILSAEEDNYENHLG